MKDWDKHGLAEELKRARGTESQASLGARAGVSDRTISMIESAQLAKPPRALTIARLAIALGQDSQGWLASAGSQLSPEEIESVRTAMGCTTARSSRAAEIILPRQARAREVLIINTRPFDIYGEFQHQDYAKFREVTIAGLATGVRYIYVLPKESSSRQRILDLWKIFDDEGECRKNVSLRILPETQFDMFCFPLCVMDGYDPQICSIFLWDWWLREGAGLQESVCLFGPQTTIEWCRRLYSGYKENPVLLSDLGSGSEISLNAFDKILQLEPLQ